MSLTCDTRGGRIVMERRTRMRKPEELRERDRLMYSLRCEGKTPAEIAKIFRCSFQHVYKRLAKVPRTVRLEIRRDVSRIREMRREAMAERIGA